MHVGIVIYEDLNRQSGGFLYDRKVVDFLRSAGHRVTVFAQPERRYLLRGLDNLDISFWRQCARSSLDVLIQDELNHASLVGGNRWLRSHVSYPIVSITHHLRSSETHPRLWARVYEWIEQRYLETVDAFVFNSKATRRAVGELVSPSPSVVARPSGRRFGPALSRERIENRAHQPGPLRILFVGNVIPRKNLHVLVEGLAQVDVDAWCLHVVGDDTVDETYTQKVHRTVDRHAVSDAVQFSGSVSDGDLQTLLQQSHLLAVPSTYEGYGIVYVEGMGHGLPAIATPHGGPVDVVDDGVTGFLVDDPIPDAIARHVRMLANDRDQLAAMGRAARRAYVASPTWEDTGRAVATFLEQLTSNELS